MAGWRSAWWPSPSPCSKLVVWSSIVPLLLLSGFLVRVIPKASNRLLATPSHQTFATTKDARGRAMEVSAEDSSSPSFAGGPIIHNPVEPEKERKKEALNPTRTTARSGKKYTKLAKIEASLAQARAAIDEAKYGNGAEDPDYVPNGPIYRHPKTFHRSYLEMERRFKVYVYEEGEPPVFHTAPCQGILGMEGIFINHMEISPFRTRDPYKAHAFFLPFSVVSVVRYVYVVDSHDWGAMKNTALDYVNVISTKHPFWNRSLGADHFMLACHDWGPEISFAVPNLYNNSIRALCNANTSERFIPARDVSIPEIHLPKGTIDGLTGGPPASQRRHLVFFAGGIHGDIRAVLSEHWQNKDKDVQIHQYLPKNVSYYDMMRSSKYCICPSGYEVASPRMVEALYVGCVPVLIKDHYVAPFSDVLNWESFSVNIQVKDIPSLKKILTGISQKRYIKMQKRGLQVRRHFEVNLPPKRYDVFHVILHSIWLRRLNIRVRDGEES
ncbi:hypothetical protein RJ639_037046 [Escallonia herrerae]|uniref:Exostosin GT47 domain-containing protein n=1 Tax=Escallonia herrerae TaxID=1293975 RepID=A0AA88WU77_9ASTE|nr:hypothetical protein RJ639_037046 [Escallonia herrerae]